MTGFLTGVAVNIICGQLGDLTGFAAEAPNSVAKAFDVLTHPGDVNLASATDRGRCAGHPHRPCANRGNTVSALVALIIPTLVVILTGAEVTRVEDQGGAIPRLPLLAVLPGAPYGRIDPPADSFFGHVTQIG